MRAYAHARGRVIIGILQFFFSLFSSLQKVGKVSTHYLKKTSRRFMENKPSFYGKQAVVL